MAIYKKIAAPGKYHDPQAIPDVVNYITRRDKTPSGIIYGVHVDMQDIANSMIAVSEKFGKNSRLRLHHFVLSFFSKDIRRPEVLPQIMEEICTYIGRVYQVVAALHEDNPSSLHIHFVFNAVSFVNGYKYHGSKEDNQALTEFCRAVLSSHGIHPLYSVNYRAQQNNPHE